jgi:hypothetical protein
MLALVVSQTSPSLLVAPPAGSVAERLLAFSQTDQVAADWFDSWKVRVNDERATLSNVDRALLSLGRALLRDEQRGAAVALPRGRGPQAALLAIALSLWRLQRGAPGAVVISSANGMLAPLLSSVTFDTDAPPPVAFGRLRGGNDGPQLRPLSGKGADRLVPRECSVLLAQPHVAHSVRLTAAQAWLMVCDTVGARGPSRFADPDTPSSWELTWEANKAAGRKQLWLGEWGDERFPEFCGERGMPLVTFDDELIGQLSAGERVGYGALTSDHLADRAIRQPAVGFWVVEDPEREHLSTAVLEMLRRMRRKGGEEPPAAVWDAYALLRMVSRLPFSLEAYRETQSGRAVAYRVEELQSRLAAVEKSAFVGRKWKEAYNEWDTVVGYLNDLVRLQSSNEHSAKFEALVLERLPEAVERKRPLSVRVLCQSREDVDALQASLRTWGLPAEHIAVQLFGRRVEHGRPGTDVTVLLAPPTRWHAGVLAGSERGRVEVLCYRHEIGLLRHLCRGLQAGHEPENAAALDALGVGPPSRAARPAPRHAAVTRLGELSRSAANEERSDDGESAEPQQELWRELFALRGTGLAEEPDDIDAAHGLLPERRYDGKAMLVRFHNAPPVLFRADAELDVLAEDDSEEAATVTLRVTDLEPGMELAFAPGLQHSILRALFDLYDGQHSVEDAMFEPMWEAVRDAARAKGVDALAAATERSKAAATTWVSGRNVPREPWRFKRMLDFAGVPEALAWQESLWGYLTSSRGPHRKLGWLHRRALVEAASGAEQTPNLDRLAAMVRAADLHDHYAAVELVAVASVSGPVLAPLAHCGHYLQPNSHYLTGAR